VVEHTEEGAMGLVLNRRTESEVEEAVPSLSDPPVASIVATASRPIGAPEMSGKRPSNSPSMNVSCRLRSSPWERGQRLRYSMRPGSASATVGRVRMLVR
jgi:hypothetical protein